MAKVLGIKKAPGASQSFYDPTCGSGSLLLKIADECEGSTSLFGQEKNVSTAALAKMNMILHDNPTAVITKGQSTLSNPLFLDDRGYLKTFDYAVANPPFSLKNWTQGFNPGEDEFNRFAKNGLKKYGHHGPSASREYLETCSPNGSQSNFCQLSFQEGSYWIRKRY